MKPVLMGPHMEDCPGMGAVETGHEIAELRAEVSRLTEELSLVKCGEPNHPDRAYAMKGWLKTFGFQVYCELKQGEVGFVLSLLQEGDISRGKAAEAIAELLVGNKPLLPELFGNTFGEDDFPSETVAAIRAELATARKAGALAALQLVADDTYYASDLITRIKHGVVVP